MDLVALLVAVVAVVLFAVRPVHWGLVALTVALVCQFVHLTGHVVHVN